LPCFFCLFIGKLQYEKAGMSFIHMEPLNVFISKDTKHSYAADTEDYLLTKAVMLAPPIKEMGQCPVPLGVLRKI
jgi:hypothetical protein